MKSVRTHFSAGRPGAEHDMVIERSSPLLDLYMLPFAGAHRNSYQSLLRPLRERGVESRTLELAGHGGRYGEPLQDSIPEMVDDLLLQHRIVRDRTVAPSVGGSRPFALFGHSMGSLLAYHIAGKLLAAGDRPIHLVVSGRGCPGLPLRPPPIHALPREAFLERISSYGGSPVEILEHREVMDLMEPILRADFRAVEEHGVATFPPLPIPITLLVGDDDHVHPDDAAAWGDLTTASFEIIHMAGGHFSLFDNPALSAEIIADAIGPSATGVGMSIVQRVMNQQEQTQNQ